MQAHGPQKMAIQIYFNLYSKQRVKGSNRVLWGNNIRIKPSADGSRSGKTAAASKSWALSDWLKEFCSSLPSKI
jgi:hypothetical protein